MRNPRAGMIPPKLAKMMINLAKIPQSAPLLDPFCGSGTILQEALLMGYKNVIGSDISPKAILNTRANLAWLKKNCPPEQAILHDAALYISDVAFLTTRLPPHSIGGIVTEPYLGPPMTGKEGEPLRVRLMAELNDLYMKSFQTFKTLLAPRARVVIVSPIIKNRTVDFIDAARSLGFAADRMLSFFYDDKKRSSFIYGRKEQKITREIFVFQKYA
jgi:tRNA (guanine10-N2)-dimethyltransferase